MGLYEKRVLHALETELVPEACRELQEKTGTNITLEIDPGTIPGSDDHAEAIRLYRAALDKIVSGVIAVCVDDFALTHLRAGLKGIRLERGSQRFPSMLMEKQTLVVGVQLQLIDTEKEYLAPDRIRRAVEAGL